ncbi:hypothetical protein FJT64_010636 [Amphibalanus amphitrite]|uniref:Peptidase A2 domain-containing protein n=1 Tax=Amphibalanus amphitrite TaxID=1232801 RepID=A0A6A4VC06_AMPAM|nr:hypothetical protein FJT64_010636 [Amphibalanus amphitrite]
MAWLGVPPVFKRNEESFGGYARRLEQFFVVNDLLIPDDKKAAVSVDAKRRAVLLTALEPDTFSLLEDLLAPAGVAEVTCARIIEVLTSHFEPDESVILSRHRFHTCSREDTETVSAFLSRLRHLARPCQFTCCAGILEEMLRDRFVSGIRNERLQSRLLSEKNLTLQSATAIATAHEAAARQAGEIAQSQTGPSGESAVHHVSAASASGSVSAAVEEEELYSLFRCSGDRRAPIKLNVMLDDRPVSMELDTGAALSVCGRFPDRTD